MNTIHLWQFEWETETRNTATFIYERFVCIIPSPPQPRGRQFWRLAVKHKNAVVHWHHVHHSSTQRSYFLPTSDLPSLPLTLIHLFLSITIFYSILSSLIRFFHLFSSFYPSHDVFLLFSHRYLSSFIPSLPLSWLFPFKFISFLSSQLHFFLLTLPLCYFIFSSHFLI